MSTSRLDRRAFASCIWCQHRTIVALIWTASLLLPDGAFAQTKEDILAQIQNEIAPAGWDPSDKVLYSFTPNDPYYFTGTPAGYPGQWHLNVQSSGAVYDANVTGAWNRDITGQGVIIGIVDDGLQRLHPDLSPNYVAADSWNFGNNTADPSPINSNSSRCLSRWRQSWHVGGRSGRSAGRQRNWRHRRGAFRRSGRVAH